MSEEKTSTPGMVIDKATGAVLNTDLGAYHMIKKARDEKRKAAALSERIDSLEHRCSELETEVAYLRVKQQDNRD